MPILLFIACYGRGMSVEMRSRLEEQHAGIARIVLVLLCRKVEKVRRVPVQLRCNWHECALHGKLQFGKVLIEIESKRQFTIWQKVELGMQEMIMGYVLANVGPQTPKIFVDFWIRVSSWRLN